MEIKVMISVDGSEVYREYRVENPAEVNWQVEVEDIIDTLTNPCLLYTSPSPRDA